jgi:NAD(P)-dependent dehydrogenase (short-subunit alcohol dehydrogenase family)
VCGLRDFSMKSRGILPTIIKGIAMGFFSFADPHYYVPTELLAKDLSGQTAIVTGATGSFGSVVSEALVKQGAHVVLAIRRLEAGQALAAEINAKGYPGKASALYVDISDLASISAFCSKFSSEHTSLHILVENAAVCCVGNTPVPGTGFEPHLAANLWPYLPSAPPRACARRVGSVACCRGRVSFA